MSVNYYALKDPITYLSVDGLPEPNIANLYMISIECHHRHIGSLIVKKKEVIEIVRLFADDDNVVYHSWWRAGGRKQLTERLGKTNKLVVISERGEVVKVKDLEKEVAETLAYSYQNGRPKKEV